MNDDMITIIKRASALHKRFGYEERQDIPLMNLGDICMLLIVLIARKYPAFHMIANDDNIVGFIRTAIETAYLLGRQDGMTSEDDNPPEPFRFLERCNHD